MMYLAIVFQISLCALIIAQAVIIAIQNKEIKAIRETQNKLAKTFEEIIRLNLEPEEKMRPFPGAQEYRELLPQIEEALRNPKKARELHKKLKKYGSGLPLDYRIGEENFFKISIATSVAAIIIGIATIISNI